MIYIHLNPMRLITKKTSPFKFRSLCVSNDNKHNVQLKTTF